MLSRNVGVMVAGGLGVAFLGYCIYFDRKRRSDPDFKKKLIERRRQQKREREEKNSSKYPDLTDEAAVQKFFMNEISLGEQLLGLGEVENGIEHLANAVAVTAHKENIINILRSSLPDPVFKLLLEKLPEVSQKIYTVHKQRSIGGGKPGISPFEQAILKTSDSIGGIEITKESLAVDDLLD